MSMASKFFLSTTLILITALSYADTSYQSLGKPADQLSQQSQWNLSILPDGTGLPIGSGTAEQGAHIFSIKCAGCHGPEGIGASAEPLVGEVGTLASDYPEKTVNSYWPYATTLFDYIRRSMPIDAPFSLTSDEVYALCAYILGQDGIIPANIDLNNENLPQVTMPNRNGFIAIYPDDQ